MVAVPINQQARVLGYELKFIDEVKASLNLPQKITIFSPVSDLSKANNKNIRFNKRYTFFNANDVFEEFGVCPAYLIARILKPKSGGGINIPFDVFPINEKNSTNTEFDLLISGDNTKDVAYNMIVNGRRYNDGREIKFTIPKGATLLEKIEIIKEAVNSNIFSPIKAELTITPPKGKKITTVDLSNKDMLKIVNGGATFVTNSNNYNIVINTAGTNGGLETKNLSSNISGILAVNSGSFNVSEDGGLPKELIFKNAGATSTLITKSMPTNYSNFTNINSTLKIKQGSKELDFVIDSNSQSAIQSTAVLDLIKISALKAVTDGSFSVQTDLDTSTIDIKGLDFSTINTIDDAIAIINTALTSANANVVISTGLNVDKLLFKSNSKGAGATIVVTSVNPVAGTDLTGLTYFDISNSAKVNGLDGIDIASLPATINGIISRFDHELKLSASSDFKLSKTTDSKNLIFKGLTAGTDGVTIALIQGDDLTSSKYLDIANAFNYVSVGAIDNVAKLLGYLELKYKELDLGSVSFDAGSNKFKFLSKSKGASSSVNITAGTTDVDLTGSTYFDISNAVIIAGIDPVADLQGVVNKLNTALQVANADVQTTLLNNKLTFENTGTVGSSSTLAINNLANHQGEQLIASNLLDITNAVVSDGNDEVDSVGLISKWGGYSSQDISVEVTTNQVNDNKTSFKTNQRSLGSSTVDLSDALNEIGDVWTTLLINIYGKDYFDVFEQFGGNSDDKTGRYAFDLFKPFVALTGTKESNVNNLIDIGKNRALDMVNSLCTAPNTKAFDFEIAGAYAELCSAIYTEEPHSTTAGRYLNDIPAPNYFDIGEMNSSTARDYLVANGISTVSLDPTVGKYEMEDHITFRRPPNQPQTAVDYKYIRNLLGIDFNVAYGVKSVEQRYLIDKTIIDNNSIATVDNTIKIKQAKGVFVTLFNSLASAAIFYSPEKAIQTLDLKISSSNPKRFDVNFQYERSETLSIISTSASASFKLGGA